MMTLPAHPLFIALQFLTTVPIKLKRQPNEKAMGLSLLYYPLVGAIIGALLSLFLWGIAQISGSLPAPMASALVLTLWVLLTGGLHLDGLADSVDAVMGGFGDRQKTLLIMKDPTSGPMGVLSLVLILLIKFTALQHLIGAQVWPVLLVAPLIGRSALVALFLTTPYVRPNGLGAMISKHMSRCKSLGVIIAALLVAGVICGADTFGLLLASALMFALARQLMLEPI